MITAQKLSSVKKTIKKYKVIYFIFLIVIITLFCLAVFKYQQENQSLQQQIITSQQDVDLLTQELIKTKEELEALSKIDQKLRNDQLAKHLELLKATFRDSVKIYEKVLDLREQKADTQKIEESLAQIFVSISKDQLETVASQSGMVNQEITKLEKLLAQKAATSIVATKTSNEAPSSGYSRQNVQTESGSFVVSLVAADLSSTRVIVDTASGSDCQNDCPTLALADYVKRNNGYAGINGSYFCPATYPNCADKKNSFDLLVMNKDKVYFNSANNVYSNNPAVIFGSGYVRFVSAASEWGRDTGVDGVLSNYPLLVSGSQSRFGGDGDPKKDSLGVRGFVANKGNIVYIGVVHSASVAQAAQVLKTLGMENAMNLDSGGSTALWSNGYVVGPGRSIPNAIVFVRK